MNFNDVAEQLSGIKARGVSSVDSLQSLALMAGIEKFPAHLAELAREENKYLDKAIRLLGRNGVFREKFGYSLSGALALADVLREREKYAIAEQLIDAELNAVPAGAQQVGALTAAVNKRKTAAAALVA